MFKGRLTIVVFLALLLLSACGEQAADVTWTEVDVPSFDWFQAAGMTEEQATGMTGETDIDLSKLRFDINADPEYQYSQMAWLDENTLFCLKTKRDYPQSEGTALAAFTLDGEETILDFSPSKSLIAQVRGNAVAYMPCYEMVFQDGITFSAWDSESRTLHPVYHFQDGYVPNTQQFFSPDGTKAAFTWAPELPSAAWRIRMVDMATGDVRDLAPPEWETDAESTVLFSYWIDNHTLSVTESDGFTAEANCISWTCTL